MTLISKYANAIQAFLSKIAEEDKEQKFKIFIRAGFQIDVYIFVRDCQHFTDIEQKFDAFCKETSTFSDLAPIKDNNNLRTFFNVLPISELDDSFYSNIVDHPNCIDYGPRYRFDSFLGQNKNNAVDKSKFPPIITFYSYKGGVGRTTTMISYALHLAAEKEKKVAIIDCDLEAPGYLNFFDLSDHPELKKGEKNGLVEFLCDTQFAGNEIDIKKYILNVGEKKQKSVMHPELNNIWLIPAGNLNDTTNDGIYSQSRQDYLEGLAKLNLGNTASVISGFNNLLEQLKYLNFDVILIDSRTGFNDIFGTATLYLSSCVVGFFGFSRQTEPGFMNLVNKHSKLQNIEETNGKEQGISSFKLILAYSILPKEINEITSQMSDFINRSYENKFPAQFFIHRNPNLERIGTGNSEIDEEFIKMSVSTQKENLFDDYKQLFEGIDDYCFPEIKDDIMVNFEQNEEKNDSVEISNNTPSIRLRNIILRHLNNILSTKVKNFAEEVTIDEEHFFYRECMKKVFEKDNFIIQGYKGTGKTYLYRALKDRQIVKKLKVWSGINNNIDYVFVNVLGENDNDPSYPLKRLNIDNTDFDLFWQIYTWNKLLFNDDDDRLLEIRRKVKEKSQLASEIMRIEGDSRDVDRFDRLMNNRNTINFIEEDLRNFNEELKLNGKIAIVLYDRLDTYLKPTDWNIIVSPLIDYWRLSKNSYSNIIPKIFIRTDLFRYIQGTNTARLSNNIINIEWTIEEVFSYFFKLVFSDKDASEAFWSITNKIVKKPNADLNYYKSLRNELEKNHNQFTLDRSRMSKIVEIFFGRYVNQNGKPWDYFKKELSNADNNSISLRPFINTLDGNAINDALEKPDRYIRAIIPPEVYASQKVREKATEAYFNDLAQDPFSNDLHEFKSTIDDTGDRFRFKSLNQPQFEGLISAAFKKIEEKKNKICKTTTDLRDLLFANGIMAEKNTRKGRFYVFAPIYWYSWGLKNGELESEPRYTLKKIQWDNQRNPYENKGDNNQ